MGRDDRRLYIGGLCGFGAAVAAALLLGHSNGTLALWSAELAHNPYIRHMFSRKNGSTVTQAVGAFIAFYGFGACLRSSEA
jgi:hypothetical protein